MKLLQLCLATAVIASPGLVPAQPARDTSLTLTPGTIQVGGTSVAIEEGRLRVKANRSGGSDATLALGFVRFASTSSKPGAPIVLLAGGPGDSGTRAIQGMPLAYLSALRAIADVVAFDQRGTGRSEPGNVVCPPTPDRRRDRATDPAQAVAALRQHVEACLSDKARDGVDVAGLTTVESADDIDALRRALGVPKLSLLAASYGTHLALATARRHPASIDRMALAGVEGPDDTLKLPSRVDAALRRIARAKRPTLFGDVRALRERLAGEPATFTFPAGQVVVLGEWDLQRWIAESLDIVPRIDAMVTAIPSMLEGDLSALAAWAVRNRLPRPINLMNLAMDCASHASPERLARIGAEAPAALLGDAINFPLPGICEADGLPRLPAGYRARATSPARALLMSGELDARTPVENADEVRLGLPNARTLVVEGAAHGLFRERAVLAAMLSFFREH